MTSERTVKLEASWKAALNDEFSKPYMVDLRSFLAQQIQAGKEIYPAGGDFFAALNLTPLPQIKVVILGQDPYHGRGQAHGLSFSVRRGVPLPPSLRNIFTELNSDLGLPPSRHGDLTAWAHQGVLLLNSVLTVESGVAGSHAKKGWEAFTDRIIAVINAAQEHVVFVLWGAYAQRKGLLIDRARHLVLSAAHPSPFSAHNGFFASRPFSQINAYLSQHGKAPIDWQLAEARSEQHREASIGQ